jgi:hypothetical protein
MTTGTDVNQAPAPTADPVEAENAIPFGRVDAVVLVLVLSFYAITRLVAITEFPIFFFCDEAIQGNIARLFVDNGFRDQYGDLLPAYFRNVKKFSLGLSIYFQALPVWLLGTTIAVVRTTSVIVGLLGAAALTVALRQVYRIRLWWAGALVMATLPTWFLHSRTAFETAMMVGFYGAFVLCYLLYRTSSPLWIVPAFVLGGATFYSYSNGQGVMFVSLLLLAITDMRHHWRVLRERPWVVVAALAIALALAAPYVRFRVMLHPEIVQEHMADPDSYVLNDAPITTKLATFGRNYARSFTPNRWFWEDTTEIVRHRMKGYGHLPLWSLPCVFIGIGVCLWRWRSPAHRLVLIAVLAAPFSGSLVGIRITRMLAMMVPATLLISLGADQVRVWLRRAIPFRPLATAVACLLVAAGLTMSVDALTNGPMWFKEYGLRGMQWGAKEVFGEARELLQSDPDLEVVVSHRWANNPDAFVDFFLDSGGAQRCRIASLEDLLFLEGRIERTTVYALTPDEYERAKSDDKVEPSEVLRVIPYPDGRPGFYFVRLAYTDQAAAIFEAEAEQRRLPIKDTVSIDGLEAVVRYPYLDLGTIADAFDGDRRTLARTFDANPCVVEIRLDEPRLVSGVRLGLWTSSYTIRVDVVSDGGEVVTVTQAVPSDDRPVSTEVELPLPVTDVVELRLEIHKNGDNHVHLREIQLLPDAIRSANRSTILSVGGWRPIRLVTDWD